MTNSRAKGCRGEREFRDVLKAHGYQARRGQQFAGGGDSPDVVSNVPGIHWEVKRVEAGSLYKWLDQAENDAGDRNSDPDLDTIPIVAHKRNRKPWVCILRADDLISILKRLEKAEFDIETMHEDAAGASI